MKKGVKIKEHKGEKESGANDGERKSYENKR